jgi:peptidoglycan/xylan/chitin deacetylase (PgdA/CDA1 family)
MKILRAILTLSTAALLLSQAACQSISVFGLFSPSETPTSTPTLTPTNTPEPTATPTITPTPEPTITPTPALLSIQAGPVTVPILLYHHVSPAEGTTRYNVLPDKFDEQMKWLYDNGYQTINVSDLANLIRNGGNIPRKPVIITIDDGNDDIYKYAFPILKKYGYFATFYVVQRYINGELMVTKDQLVEMIKGGWEIGSHSKHHVDLRGATIDLQNEMRMSKLEMEDLLGVPINSFAYPFGYVNDQILAKIWTFGYTSAVGLGSSTSHSKQTLYYLSRIEIEGTFPLEQFKAFFGQ